MAPSTTSLITQPVNLFRSMVSLNPPQYLENALVASRGDASAIIDSGGKAQAEVSSRTGYARIFKPKGDFVIESHGTGQAGRVGNTMWALDGDSMAMAHLPSSEPGGMFCPCSMSQDARTCDCACHGGHSVRHAGGAEQRQRSPSIPSNRRRHRRDYSRRDSDRKRKEEHYSDYSDSPRRIRRDHPRRESYGKRKEEEESGYCDYPDSPSCGSGTRSNGRRHPYV